MFGWTLIWSMIGMIGSFLDPTGRLYSFMSHRGWSPQTLWIGGIRSKVTGLDGIDWSRPYVICSNHQSQIDIPLIVAKLPTGIRFLAKHTLFYIPLFGWSMYVAGYVPVNRSSGAKAHRSIINAARRIRNGRPSLLVFPEGTRTDTGEIQPFKSGAFIMAIHANAPILPIAVRGTFDAASKGRFDLQPGQEVEVVVGAPIETEGLSTKDKEALKIQVRNKIQTMFETGIPATSTQ
jgi:1-acyl-sn-glycerol-3-phosphate acyltransferase